MTTLNVLQQKELDELAELFSILGIEENGTLPEMTDEIKERFTIENLEQLNWALRKLSALSAKRAQINVLRDAEIKRISDWHAKEAGAITGAESFFEYLISDYAAARRMADEKYKGDKTPYGKIGFRKQQPGWDYKDEKALVSWLEASGRKELVKVEKTAIKTELKKVVTIDAKKGHVIDPITGEIVPGIEIKEKPDAIDIKPEV